MATKIFLLLVLCVGSGLSLINGEEPSAQRSPTYEEATAVLPQSSQHQFLPVDPAWQKVVYVKHTPDDGELALQNSSPRYEKSPPYIINYYKGASTEEGKEIKIVVLYPDGKPCTEDDNLHGEIFSRQFFPDGTFSSFTHRRNEIEFTAGVAIDPQTKKENHFAGGEGSLMTYSDAHHSIQLWFHRNTNFLEIHREHGRRTIVMMHFGQEMFTASRAEEELLIKGEIWTRKAGKGPIYQSDDEDSKSDVPELGVMMGPAEVQEREIRETEAKWKTIYENQRRPAFLKRFAAALVAAGQSWQSVDLEFIRDGGPWPDR